MDTTMLEIAGVTIYSRKGYGHTYGVSHMWYCVDSNNHYTVIVQYHGLAQDEYSYGQAAGM